MQEIIYKIENWTIFKLVGGFTFVLGVAGFIFRQVIKYYSEKNMEVVKGEIVKSNSILSAIIDNHLQSSQKIMDRKVDAYEKLWSCVLQMREHFPSVLSIVNNIYTEDELKSDEIFNQLSTNTNIGPELYNLVNDGITFNAKMMHQSIAFDRLKEIEPYISDTSYQLLHGYYAIISRVTFNFIEHYKMGKVAFWKNDSALLELLKTILTKEEIDYVLMQPISSLRKLIDLVEYKIIQDFKYNLSIKDSIKDTIRHLRDMEIIFNNTKNIKKGA